MKDSDKLKRLFTPMIILAFLIFPQFSLPSDLDDLKTASEKLTQAFNSHDTETAAYMIYPGQVTVDSNSASPEVVPMQNTQASSTEHFKSFFNQMEIFSIKQYNMQYRVIGNTGIVWGHQTMTLKPKGEPSIIVHQITTETWIKSEGKWYQIMYHDSAVPSED